VPILLTSLQPAENNYRYEELRTKFLVSEGRDPVSARKKTSPPQPTAAELEILRVLWERGASTVHEVRAVLEKRRSTGYTTALKLLQIMAEKGLVRRDERQRAHVYQARIPREQTEKQLVGDLLERAFGGEASRLVMQVLSAKKASREELDRVRKILDGLEGGAR
jgi:BlaI family transcriptional regulator, penicillinase repressor